MFFRVLDAIRRKPKAVREQYALGFTLCLVGIIGLAWLWLLPGRFADISMTPTDREASRPFAQFFSQFRDEVIVRPTDPLSTSTDSVTTSTSEGTATATTPVLELTPETLRQVAKQPATGTASSIPSSPRVVRIATSSHITASSSD